ncbi:MAG: hypothetical protein JRJ39_02205 [Deltaproteobacteria bacterium]|nr:hypothetical protein [Deltaproteobacteria bacterium]
MSEDSWYVWSKHVLMQLETDGKCLRELKESITKLRVEVGQLKVKSGIWGLIGGAVPVAIGLAVWLLKTSK